MLQAEEMMVRVLFVMPGREPDAARVLEIWRQQAPDLDGRVWSPATASTDEDAVVAVVWNHPHGSLADLPRLRGVVSFGAGVDGLLQDPSLPRDILIGRTVDSNLQRDLVEYVQLAVLAWRRSWRRLLEAQQEQRWAPEAYRRDGTIAVLGLGALGQAVAEHLDEIQLGRVVGWSRTQASIPGVRTHSGRSGLADAVADADEVVCCLPLNAETEGILDRRLFRAMRPGSYLINIGRGRHLVEADLLAALDDGQLGGACLDVFAEEPLPPGHPFWSDRRITVTPHVASLTDPGSVAGQLAESVRRIAAGQPPAFPVDRKRGY
jgi:glyoxylate/hydroxypyruvate reductase A